LKELDFYSRTGQWDKILDACQGPLSNYLYICHANLALLQKGELGERLFDIDQRGVEGLLINWNKTTSSSILLSDIYFALDLVAQSQEKAFEANVSAINEGNPRVIKRLIQTNLIFGAYPVAEKYIRLLERTYGYRHWAESHRRFLYNDTAVAADPLLGSKRQALMRQSRLSLMDGIYAELLLQAANNPASPNPLEYAAAFCLLSKDREAFRSLLETYYLTGERAVLPRSLQEAVILFWEQDADYRQRFRLSEDVISRFSDFRRLLVANRNSDTAKLQSILQTAHQDTYWFYFMFK
jgi:hypothetical protein